MPLRIFYASAGRANLIRSHEYWAKGEENPDEVALTFSGQVEEAATRLGAALLMVSDRADGGRLEDGAIRIEHLVRPKDASGLGFYINGLRYALTLVRRARRFRADIALVDTGVMPFFMLSLFRLAGIKVVPILHNTLWAEGFRPTGKLARLVMALDRLFWRRGPAFVLAVSSAIERQLRCTAGAVAYPIRPIRAQFVRDYFASITPPIRLADEPFQMMFVGRLVREKGVFDIVDMARLIERDHPGLVRWTLCGGGPDLEAVRESVAAAGLTAAVDVRGRVEPADLRRLYPRIHACIVPTRSSFPEGLAMTAVEDVLERRPVVTNKVVPALELVRSAAMEAEPDNAASHAQAVIALATDEALYARLQAATLTEGEAFYDRAQGLAAVLEQSLGEISRPRR
mgnify:CR=1 FL=1